MSDNLNISNMSICQLHGIPTQNELDIRPDLRLLAAQEENGVQQEGHLRVGRRPRFSRACWRNQERNEVRKAGQRGGTLLFVGASPDKHVERDEGQIFGEVW